MRNIPVDTSALTFMSAGGAQPKLKDRDTGEVKTTDDGRTLYAVPVMVIADGQGELIRITVAAAEPPLFAAGTPLSVSGLVAFAWAMNGRSGIGFRAETIVPAAESAKEAA